MSAIQAEGWQAAAPTVERTRTLTRFGMTRRIMRLCRGTISESRTRKIRSSSCAAPLAGRPAGIFRRQCGAGAGRCAGLQSAVPAADAAAPAAIDQCGGALDPGGSAVRLTVAAPRAAKDLASGNCRRASLLCRRGWTGIGCVRAGRIGEFGGPSSPVH